MSDTETPRRSSLAPSAVPSETPKRRSKGRSRRSKTPERKLPFHEQDEYSNVIIKVGDKQLYTNECLLVYNCPGLKDELQNDNSNGKGRGKQSSPANKELDWSSRGYDDVCIFLCAIDPRVDEDITDDNAMRLLPLAKEFQVRPLEKLCEKTITESFYNKRRSRRANMDTVIQHLSVADKYELTELRQMCIDACMRTTNNRYITSSTEICDKTKVEILSRKLDVPKRRPRDDMKLEDGKATSRMSEH